MIYYYYYYYWSNTYKLTVLSATRTVGNKKINNLFKCRRHDCYNEYIIMIILKWKTDNTIRVKIKSNQNRLLNAGVTYYYYYYYHYTSIYISSVTVSKTLLKQKKLKVKIITNINDNVINLRKHNNICDITQLWYTRSPQTSAGRIYGACITSVKYNTTEIRASLSRASHVACGSGKSRCWRRGPRQYIIK